MRNSKFVLAALLVGALLSGACGSGSGSGLSGQIEIDGSSTVFPISEAVAEEFQIQNPGVNVKVGLSGTGGGFKKFCNGELDISDASRTIKDEEAANCAAAGVEYTEMQIAMDGLSVVVNHDATFVDCLTLDELKKIWMPGSTVKTWADVRPGFPAEDLKLYSPGADSGTFDYFTSEVNGEEDAQRTEGVQTSEDDNQLVTGVAGDKYAIGYFGFAYYEENTDKVKAIGVDAGAGCVKPTSDAILDGSYTPLSRPIYIYPKTASLERPEVKAFIEFYLDNVTELAPEVGYVAPPATAIEAAKAAVGL